MHSKIKKLLDSGRRLAGSAEPVPYIGGNGPARGLVSPVFQAADGLHPEIEQVAFEGQDALLLVAFL